MRKGLLTPFSFLVFYIIVFSMVTLFMAGTGFTGVSSNGTLDADCPDAVNCGLSFYDNIIVLLTFQSEYEFFNYGLTMAYIILIVAVIGLIAGA